MTNTFKNGSVNTKAVVELMTSKDDIFCAVAFWGSGGIALLKNSLDKNPKRKITIICNLESGATNPDFVSWCLKNPKNFTILTSSKLHANVILGAKKYIVGSTNISANGLGHKNDETNGLMEASITGDDAKTAKEILSWFKSEEKKAKKITTKMLKEARLVWARRKQIKEFEDPGAKSLIEHFINNPDDFIGKNINLAIYKNDFDENANEALNTFKENGQVQDNKKKHNNNLDPFQNWPNLPKDAYLIKIKYTQNKVSFTGLSYIPIHPAMIDFEDTDGEVSNLAIGTEIKKIYTLPLSKKDKDILKRSTPDLFKIGKGDSDAVIVTLDARCLEVLSKFNT